MKVKMADIARYLGVSKATVSLAVNDKPGVNEQTKQEILSLVEYAKHHDGTLPPKTGSAEESRVEGEERSGYAKKENTAAGNIFSNKLIKLVRINRGKQVIQNTEMDLWTDVLATFDREARKYGAMNSLTYLDVTGKDAMHVIRECNQDIVAGVVLFATEMEPADMELIKKIKKPIVFYDYEAMDGSISSVCIDNRMAVRFAVNELFERGYRKFLYVSTDTEIYNFRTRRNAFRECLYDMNITYDDSMILPAGSNVQEMTDRAEHLLRKLPEDTALILENYQVSIGVIAAMNRIGTSETVFRNDQAKQAKGLPIVGIDEIPSYLQEMAGFPRVIIPHMDRAVIAIDLLYRECTSPKSSKVQVLASPKLEK